MLHEVGGWSRYRAGSAEFAYQAGYLNSVWYLGVVDASVRYAVKLGMALLWTLGPCLLFVPRGLAPARRQRWPWGWFLIAVLGLSMLPALASHLLVHFGVPGYAFHYVPALLGLAVLGIGEMATRRRPSIRSDGLSVLPTTRAAAPRLVAVSALMAGLFLFYPTDYASPGMAGQLRPLVRAAHANRPAVAHTGSPAFALADRQLAGRGTARPISPRPDARVTEPESV